ncbi:hypothetical protein BXY82_0288 [Gelidibacter sediminis]|uniref:Uncharacterized protein n=1 Tax=Gelidibacter sediminis TaxID=1608710 RepID=A0A4R7Q7P4_9FLAO|nr:hypothetical protein [Gelidibacter sediminis]TDU42889.1 hypothetical protein BXY82_0288 [Gelidibacter sediminis]
MKLKLIDYPVEISNQEYQYLKNKLISELLAEDSVISVYQMGSVKHPGISDLDIICVFKNNSQCLGNYRVNLNADEKNILTHAIFGIEEKDLPKSMSYNLISNLNHLGGADLGLNNYKIETSDDLKTQIAFEYMLKMLITIDAQVTLKIIKLRAFLLLAKAIEFDLQLLNVNTGKLYDLVQCVIEYRAKWYISKPSDKEIRSLVLNFNDELRLFLKERLSVSNFYLPAERFNLPGNFTIQKDNKLSINHKGIVLPNQFSFLGKKYINLQFRLNNFTYRVPFETPSKNSEHYNRFLFSKNLVSTNKNNFPNFIPLTTSLSIF